jgi:FkbM family methyltransferase
MTARLAVADRPRFWPLRRVAQAAYAVPGARSAARHLLRAVCQESGLSRQHKQQLHNLFAVDVAPSGVATFSTGVDGAEPISVRAPIRDDMTRYWYFWGYAHYEAATIRLLTELLRRKRVFVDVGANLGYYTLLAGRLLEGRGVVHAFEPWGDMFDHLHANVMVNGFRQVYAHRLALADWDGQARLFIPRAHEWTNASLIKGFVPSDGYEWVPTMRFDAFCALHAVDRVDLIKLDVEGAELCVLEGMGDLLDRWQPDIILEVLEPYAAAIDTFFAGSAYRKFRIRPAGLEPIQRITARPHDRNVFLSCDPL